MLQRIGLVPLVCLVIAAACASCSSNSLLPPDGGSTGGAGNCLAGLTPCGSACVDIRSDGSNCGACGTPCSGAQVCSSGKCATACASTETECGQSCVDLETNVSNCHACGTVCPSGASCVAGVCSGGPGGTGGSSGTGGTSGGTGGASGGTSSGGSGTGGTVTVGSCSRTVGSCTAPTVRVTDVSLGSAVTAYGNEGDTLPLPMALAAMPSGGSRLAWLGSDGNVHVGLLDCDDHLVGTPFTFPGEDLQDLYADDDGGVVLLTRGATNGGTDNCGTGMLCGGTSSPCSAMYMVRFDNSGNVAWTTQVTNVSPTLAGYTNGARFVWWYQHHGRLAFDGSNYAAYHGVAITVNNGACVDIHEGDRMQVVSSTGELLTGHDSFPVGCSHSWTTRIVWDPRTAHFVMVCATDNNCRIAQPNPYRTVATGTCDGTLFGGDLVLSSTAGYFTAWSQGGAIRLEHFTTGASDQTISNAGSSSHPHLVSYGPGKMLLAWGSGSSMAAQVRDAGTGAAIGSQFTINANDHDYMAFKAYTDGSAAYPASGASNTSASIARVMPCN